MNRYGNTTRRFISRDLQVDHIAGIAHDLGIFRTLRDHAATAADQARRTLGEIAQNVRFDIAERLFPIFSEDVGDDAVFTQFKIFIRIDRSKAVLDRKLLRDARFAAPMNPMKNTGLVRR